MPGEARRVKGASNRRVLYGIFAVPGTYPPLQSSSTILAEAGWDVRFVGLRGTGQTEAVRLAEHERISAKLLPPRPPGIKQKLSYLRYLGQMIWEWVTWRPKWVYVSDPISTPIGLILSLLGARVVYHEHDGPSLEQKNSPPIWLRCRDPLARRAELCVLPNQARIRQFESTTGRTARTLCVHNCPRLSDVQAARTGFPRELILLYSGSIGADRIPEGVIRSLRRLPEEVRLWIVGFELGGGGYLGRIDELRRELGLGDRLRVLAGRSRGELWSILAKCDVGLSVRPLVKTDPNFVHMVGATNKAFDYFAAGMPILVSELPEWMNSYVAEGMALACDPDDAESVERAIRRFWDDRAGTLEMGERGRKRVEAEWNYEMQFAPVLEAMESEAEVARVR